jgi:hypothetical protein
MMYVDFFFVAVVFVVLLGGCRWVRVGASAGCFADTGWIHTACCLVFSLSCTLRPEINIPQKFFVYSEALRK